MGNTDRLHDRESEARPTQIAASRFVGSEKAFKHMGESVSRNSYAVVGDFQHSQARVLANGNPDLAALLRVLDRIVHVVHDHLLQSRAIALDKNGLPYLAPQA